MDLGDSPEDEESGGDRIWKKWIHLLVKVPYLGERIACGWDLSRATGTTRDHKQVTCPYCMKSLENREDSVS